MMTDTPMPDWVLLEAAKRSWWFEILQLSYLQRCYGDIKFYRALCDMILKHEQPPMDRKLLCAREAERRLDGRYRTAEMIAVRAIELWEEGFGK
jgi:DNA-binding PucR family transcriptional regulator